ncbi:hypothetical protein LC605_20915 [Nostoc sp. CHAB 5836]|nr:hypothetical protein [Nostoc sp. CHAB 5836]
MTNDSLSQLTLIAPTYLCIIIIFIHWLFINKKYERNSSYLNSPWSRS